MAPTSAALIAIVFLSFVVESAIGFGATVITVALAAQFVSIDALLPAVVPVNMVVSAYIAIRDRQAIDVRTLYVRIVPGMLVGLPIGILVLGRLDARVLKILFGAFVIALSGVELLRMRRSAAPKSPGKQGAGVIDFLLLIVGGAIHGAFGTGGPMAVYVAAKLLGDDRRKFRATLAGLWLTLNVGLMTSFALRGLLNESSVKTSAWVAPGVALGTVIGTWAHSRIPQRAFRTGIFVLLTGAAAVLIARAI